MDTTRYIRVICQASLGNSQQVLNGLQQKIEQVTERAKAMHKAFADSGGPAGLATLGSALQSVGALAGRVFGMIVGWLKGLVGGILDLAGKIVGALGEAFSRVLSLAGRFASVVGGAIGEAATAFTVAGIKANIFQENLLRTMTAMLHSRTAAQDLVTWLNEFAKVRPFIGEEIDKAAVKLVAFKMNARELMPIVTDVAKVFGKSPEMVAETLGRMKAGMVEVRELGEIGLEKEDLTKHGVELDSKDSPLHRSQVLPAVVASLQEKYGGASAATGDFDAVSTTVLTNFRKLAELATKGFFERIKSGMGRLGDVLQGLIDNGSVVRALAVPFDLLGVAIEKAAVALPGFVQWLTQILTRENIVAFLGRVAGWIGALRDQVMAFVGAVTGGRSFTSIWEGFQAAAAKAIDFVLKIWGGFVGGVAYVSQHADELWGAIKDAINLVVAAVETLVGAAGGLFAVMTVAKFASLTLEVLKLANAFKDVGTGIVAAGKAFAQKAGGAVTGTGFGEAATETAVAGGSGVGAAAAPVVGYVAQTAGWAEMFREMYGAGSRLARKSAEIKQRRDLSTQEKRALLHEMLIQEHDNRGPILGSIQAARESLGIGVPAPKLNPREQAIIAGVRERERRGDFRSADTDTVDAIQSLPQRAKTYGYAQGYAIAQQQGKLGLGYRSVQVVDEHGRIVRHETSDVPVTSARRASGPGIRGEAFASILSGLGSGDVPNIGGAAQSFGKYLIEKLAGGVVGAAPSLLAHIPDTIKNFTAGLQQAIAKGAAQSGTEGILNAAAQYSAQAEQAINKALGPGRKADPNAVPGMLLVGRQRELQGGGGAATVGSAAAPDPAEVKKAIETRDAYFDALIEQARVVADSGKDMEMLSPVDRAYEQARRSAEQVRTVIPALIGKQQDLYRQAALVGKNTTEYFQIVKQAWSLQGQIAQLQQGATRDQNAAFKAAQQGAVELLDAQANYAEAVAKNDPTLRNNPYKAIQSRMQSVVPALLEKYKALKDAFIPGESQADELKRLTEAENTKGEILKAAGYGDDAMGKGVWTLDTLAALRNAQRRMVQQFRRTRQVADIPKGFDPTAGMLGRINSPAVREAMKRIQQADREIGDGDRYPEKGADAQPAAPTINFQGPINIGTMSFDQFREMWIRAGEELWRRNQAEPAG